MTSKKTAVKAPAPFVAMSVAEANKSIDSIAKLGAKLDAQIHHTAVSALTHHATHGDTTLINRLILAMPKSGRKNALVAWAVHFGGLLINDDKASRDAAPLLHVKDAPEFDQDAALAEPFWMFKAKEGTAVWSFDAYLTSLTKGLTTAIEKASGDEAAQAKLRAALAALATA